MPTSRKRVPATSDSKHKQLDGFHEDPTGEFLTTDQGVRVVSNDDSLRAGDRGPTLLEDFHLREKIMRFDHERIPERVVHARGAGAHGYFQVYKPLTRYTTAASCKIQSRKPQFSCGFRLWSAHAVLPTRCAMCAGSP